MTQPDSYLAELHHHLRGRPLAKRRILREIEAHLEDAIRREMEEGVSRDEAERRAIDRLGPADELGQRFHEGGGRMRAAGLALAAAAACAAIGFGAAFGSEGVTSSAGGPKTVTFARAAISLESDESGNSVVTLTCERGMDGVVTHSVTVHTVTSAPDSIACPSEP